MIKNNRWTSIFLLVSLIFTNFSVGISSVSAQGISILGEIRTNGKVFIETSDGQWALSGPTYPLIQNTAIKTEDGTASVYFKDGSIVSLSRGTEAVIDGSQGHYGINLSHGVVAFNMIASSYLSVDTVSGRVVVSNKKGLVQKVSYDKRGRMQGVISSTNKGTEIRNISGELTVSINASETKVIAAGESIFIGGDNTYKVYKTQAVAQSSGGEAVGLAAGASVGTKILAGALGAAYIAGGIYSADKAFDPASPSTP